VKRGGGKVPVALLSFAAGLMAKPMLVTSCGSAAAWTTGRSVVPPWGPCVKEKIPFFALSGRFLRDHRDRPEQGGAMKTLDAIPLGSRIGNAVIAYVKYIGKMFWPADLAMLYPFPGSIPLWQVSVSVLLLVLFSALAIGYRRRHPYLCAGCVLVPWPPSCR